MAKFVGKVFRVPNVLLGIKRRGTHNVHITWFDPRKKVFHGKIITSLEDHITLNSSDKKVLNTSCYTALTDGSFAIFNNKKLNLVRDGYINPIPITSVIGSSVWCGYYGKKIFTRNLLSSFKLAPLQIKKENK